MLRNNFFGRPKDVTDRNMRHGNLSPLKREPATPFIRTKNVMKPFPSIRCVNCNEMIEPLIEDDHAIYVCGCGNETCPDCGGYQKSWSDDHCIFCHGTSGPTCLFKGWWFEPTNIERCRGCPIKDDCRHGNAYRNAIPE